MVRMGPTVAASGGAFANFDPRVDGLSALVGDYWSASDCPMRMVKVGSDATDWAIDGPGEAIFAACSTAAEINALYRGLARQPSLDFTPTHLLVPDPDNDRLADLIAGHHLTRQGLGVGASIERSPLGDGGGPLGWRAEQLGANASYYAAASDTQYVVTTDAFVVGFAMSTSRNGGGGLILGKYADAGLSGKGWGVSSNGDGRFGFLQNGTLTDLNTDLMSGQRVDDGKLRLFHTGRTVLGAGKGFVRTADIAPVEVVGNAGDLTANVSTPFGLMADNAAGTRIASGDQQYQAIAFWSGAAAENVVAYLDEIEQGLSTRYPSNAGAVMSAPLAVFNQGRTIGGAAFRPDGTRPCWVTYTIEFSTAGQSTSYVTLKADAFNPPTTVRARFGGGVSVAIINIFTGQLHYIVPAGWYVKLEHVDVAGAGSSVIREQCEVPI